MLTGKYQGHIFKYYAVIKSHYHWFFSIQDSFSQGCFYRGDPCTSTQHSALY